MINSMQDVLNLKGKSVIITGGNRGIGKGISLAMAECGANVIIICRDSVTAVETITELKKFGGKYKYYIADVCNLEQCKKSINDAIRDFGKIDVLVNNAGTVRIGEVLDMDKELRGWYDVINTNLNGPFIMSYVIGKHFKQNKNGCIINISSNAARIVNKPQKTCSYNTAKAGLDRMTKCLSYEWAPYNIRLNVIAPGCTDTDLECKSEIRQYIKHWKAQTPTGRFAKPLEIGALAVYLASEAAEQITGSVFTIDGGYMLAI